MTKHFLIFFGTLIVVIQCQDSKLAINYINIMVVFIIVTVVPSYSKVCPHDNVTINCTTYTGNLQWFDYDEGIIVAYSFLVSESATLPYKFGSFYVTNVTNNSGVLSSTVTLYNTTTADDITCLNGQLGGVSTTSVLAIIELQVLGIN